MMSLEKYMPAWVKRVGLVTVVVLFGAGILFWGGFNWALEETNKESFCISCHEMEENVFKEYQNTVHYTNRTGVRATCPDCHVPKEWGPKMVRKIQAPTRFSTRFSVPSTRRRSSMPSVPNSPRTSGSA